MHTLMVHTNIAQNMWRTHTWRTYTWRIYRVVDRTWHACCGIDSLRMLWLRCSPKQEILRSVQELVVDGPRAALISRDGYHRPHTRGGGCKFPLNRPGDVCLPSTTLTRICTFQHACINTHVQTHQKKECKDFADIWHAHVNKYTDLQQVGMMCVRQCGCVCMWEFMYTSTDVRVCAYMCWDRRDVDTSSTEK